MPPATKRRRYNEEAMKSAILAVVEGGITKKAAAAKYGIPRTTLIEKLSGKYREGKGPGRDPYLTDDEEEAIATWIKKCCRRGLPPHKNDILNTVQRLIKDIPGRESPFQKDRPGRRWFEGFMRRHQDLSVRIPEHVSKARCQITESSIRKWFGELRQHITEDGCEDIFIDPARIFNTEESSIQLCPSTEKVIGLTGHKNVYEVASGPEKSNLTFLGTFSAQGDIVAPMIIYPYARLPKNIANAVPDEFIIGTSESGWMKAETFYEFIANAFLPWLNDKSIKRPVILFVDGHKTHITLQTSTLCEDNGIILYCLLPNMTQILQPADVGPFNPLKMYWRQAVVKFQRENPNSVVRRKDVAPLLKDVLQLVSKQSIINGFRACGLYPLNEDQIDYKKCLDIDKDEEEVQQSSSKPSTPAVQLRPSKEQLEISLSTIYTLLGPEKSQRLKQGQLLDNDDWHGMYKELVVQAAQQPDEESCVSVKQEQEEIVLQLLLDPINLQLHQPMKLSKSEDP
ncbi:MFS-type transporter clz9-like [Hyalella azteca]|uniref:MFS-type transporter clz9-like n=1 Tax=Hyalella azteca TaxID=294128 RepID=A0A8B7NYG2_HYAAZ|nr:MFS-type transporter clz9-like [Hyalella azteca]